MVHCAMSMTLHRYIMYIYSPTKSVTLVLCQLRKVLQFNISHILISMVNIPYLSKYGKLQD